MMDTTREIKFRAYLKKENRIVKVAKIDFTVGKIYVIETGKTVLMQGGFKTKWYPFKDIILLQYTGIKDKNKIEIYEGDIVKFNPFDSQGDYKLLGVVYYCDIFASYKVIVYHNGRKDETYSFKKLNFLFDEVIGNIYENPELLEAK